MSDTPNERLRPIDPIGPVGPIGPVRPIWQKELAQALGLLDPEGLPATLAFVGAGGKTSSMYAVAERMAYGGDASSVLGDKPCRVIVTTTTHIRDPRLENQHRKELFSHVIFESELDAWLASHDAQDAQDAKDAQDARNANPIVVASGLLPDEGKLAGVSPQKATQLAACCDLLLVEADGSRGRPVKAPAEYEPVVPPNATMVVGVVGLDCLGCALGPDVAHRAELFDPLVGCAQGQKIEPQHLVRLVRSPQGLFKGSPEASKHIVLLNKADLAPHDALDSLLELLAAQPRTDDGKDFSVLVSCLGDGGMPKRERDSDTDRKGSQ